jgi:HlyD family secretion protein
MAKTSRYKRSLASNWILLVILALAVGGLGFLAWQQLRPQGLPQGIAGSNGRIEATEIDIAAKLAGRISEILVREGQFVRRGEDLVKMDTSVLEAQLREAKAQLEQAQVTVETARSQVSQRESEKATAEAVVAQREAELAAARQRFSRAEQLVKQGWATQQRLDDDRAAFESAQAAVTAAKAQVASAEATLNTAKSQVLQAEAQVEAARATIERIQADINDSVLRAPRDGRIQFLVAQPGEVVQAGGRVLNMIDITDVYMTFFLPTEQAGRVAIGAEARIVIDAAPQYVIPASISFVSDVAQFTPKEVETAEERQKLMFRLRARIDKELLERYLTQVKTGLPGMAYVKIDPRAEWPPHLQVRLPEPPQ